jgi:hypothetical protein
VFLLRKAAHRVHGCVHGLEVVAGHGVGVVLLTSGATLDTGDRKGDIRAGGDDARRSLHERDTVVAVVCSEMGDANLGRARLVLGAAIPAGATGIDLDSLPQVAAVNIGP